MKTSGSHTFLALERVLYGQPCAEALAAEAARLQTERVFLLVSKTLNASTDVISGRLSPPATSSPPGAMNITAA